MSNLNVALTLSLNDRLVAPLQRALNEVQKGVQAIEKDLLAANKASGQANATMASMQGPQMAAKQAAELARNTQNAIGLAERLKSAFSGVGTVIKGVAAGAAGFQAAKYVMAAPLKDARSYDRQLADSANTAFSSRDQKGREAGITELDATVKGALRTGGGKREDTLGALNEMLASGSVSDKQAKALLPVAATYATAGNADIKEISSIIIRALQSGFKEADIPKILDMALDAGQRGGFELKDMAKWLPKLLAAGNMSGLTGMDGYARILGSAQGSVITAGSKDEAGNNLLNLLLKINSSDTAKDAQKLGIDLSGTLAAARGKGMNSLDAFVGLVDNVAGQDKRMVSLRKQAAASGTAEEKKATLNAQADILQGSAIGKIVQDRQALLALVAELNKRDYIRSVTEGVKGANGQIGAANFDLIAGRSEYKTQQAENEKLFALTDGLNPVNTQLGKLAEATTDLYRKYPGYSTVVELAKWAIGGLAAAAAGAGATLGILGLIGKGAPAAAAAAAAASGAAPAAGGVAAAGGLLGAAPVLGAGLVAGGAVLGAGYLMSESMNSTKGLADRMDTRSQRLQELQELARLDPGGKYNPEIEKLRTESDALRDKYGAQVGGGRGVVNPPMNVNVYLDGQQIQSSVNNRNNRDARRN